MNKLIRLIEAITSLITMYTFLYMIVKLLG